MSKLKKFLENLKGVSRHATTIIGGGMASGVLDGGNGDSNTQVLGSLLLVISLFQSAGSYSKKDFTDKLYGGVRHLLTFFGGYGIFKGWFAGEQGQEAISMLITAGGLVWSYFFNKTANNTEESSTADAGENNPGGF